MSDSKMSNSTRKKRHNPEEQVWDEDISPLMDLIVDKVRIKQAAEVGKRAVDYFRGQDFKKWVLSNTELINKKFYKALDELNLVSSEDVDKLGERLIRYGFICKADYKPLSGTSELNENGEVRRPKWPKRLQVSRRQMFDENGFYIVLYEGSKTWKYFMLGLILAAVLVLCMFPAWPLSIKIGVWYTSVFFMTFIIAVVVGRLAAFLLLWFFGVDFWILPNLFDEEAGVTDSFFPLMTFERRKDDWVMLAARAFCAILLAAAIYKLQQTHSVSDVGAFARQSLLDVLDWGNQKLAATPANPTNSYPSIEDIHHHTEDDAPEQPDVMDQQDNNAGTIPDSDKDINDILSEADEDYTCLAKCGFADYKLLSDDCLLHCSCMKELCSSPCYSKCSENVRKTLDDARLDACYDEEINNTKQEL